MGRRVFENRQDAGRLLGGHLCSLDLADAVVLGLPRGGVPVAAEVACVLGAPLDVLLVRKLGAPHEPELAIGAVVDGEMTDVVLNEDIIAELGLAEADLIDETNRQRAVLQERRNVYRVGRTPLSIKDKTVIVVDDGAATGATLRVALKGVRRRQPRRLIAAVPVASISAFDLLKREADDVVCLSVPQRFGAVGFHYCDFSQVTDEEVVQMLSAADARKSA
jgi:putative phosphoribosyl transferase